MPKIRTLKIRFYSHELDLLLGVLNYYASDRDSYAEWSENRQFAQSLSEEIKGKQPYSRKLYRFEMNKSQIERLLEALLDYGWEDEAWEARPASERVALIHMEVRLNESLEKFVSG